MNCHTMSRVSNCEADQCFYNSDRQCHVPAINVGGETHPRCDTFIPRADHIGCMGTSGVGACHTSLCKYNTDLTCDAAEISVGLHADHADCVTFESR